MKKSASIRRQLLLWLLIPLLSLAIVSTILANMLGVNLARNIYDKQLLNSADSVVARLKVHDAILRVDLPPAARAILRHNNQDDFYFQILTPEGQRITGDEQLPPPIKLPMEEGSEPTFRTIQLGDKQLRVVCLLTPVSDYSLNQVIVEAAETRNTRSELAGQITMSILFAQLLLIASGGIAIWIGIGRGLLPLTNVEKAVESRMPGDLSPLSVVAPVEVNSLIKALNRLFQQLKDDLDLQERFISNAAHQLRTPLAALGIYSDLARKMTSDQALLAVLDDLDNGINRMTKLVNRLLSLARSEPQVAAARANTIFDLNNSASVMAAAHVPQALKKKIEIEFLSADEPALVYGEPNAVEELLSNLIENAVVYGPTGGSVIVKVLNENGRASVVVEDDGPGIPPAERGRVFERFYRMPGTDKPGTGLGLAIVREIAHSHNAVVDIASGSTFRGTAIRVEFPAPALTGSGGARSSVR
ncbi:MAG TPA: sensor histidine kinase [Drouetiella sp.]|jgi:two-component system, OmpR family, sensor histidine kinase TctE